MACRIVQNMDAYCRYLGTKIIVITAGEARVESVGNLPGTKTTKKGGEICILRRRRVSRGSRQLAGRPRVYPSLRGEVLRAIIIYNITVSRNRL